MTTPSWLLRWYTFGEPRFLSETHEQTFEGLAEAFSIMDGGDAFKVMQDYREVGPALYALAALAYKGEEMRQHVGPHRVGFPALLEAAGT